MGALQVTIVFLLLVGIFMVFYAYKNLKNEKKIEIDTSKYDEMFDILNISVDEANKSGEDLNKMATEIFTELENKHQELMVIYKLIDEKGDKAEKGEPRSQKIQATNKVVEHNKDLNTIPNEFKINIESNMQNTKKSNKKKEDVLALKNQGMDVDEIAKKLSLGKREVKLIIDFSEGTHE